MDSAFYGWQKFPLDGRISHWIAGISQGGRNSNSILPYTSSLPSFYHRWWALSITGINIDILLLSHYPAFVFVLALFRGGVQYT